MGFGSNKRHINIMRGQTTTTFAFATVMSVAALSVVSVAFGTNNWLETTVDRLALRQAGISVARLNNLPVFFTRYRGLFRTCFPGNDTACMYAHVH